MAAKRNSIPAKPKTTTVKPKPKTEQPAKIERIQVAELTGIEEVSPFQEPATETPEPAAAPEAPQPPAEDGEPEAKTPEIPHVNTILDYRWVDDNGTIYQLDHHGIRGIYILRAVGKE